MQITVSGRHFDVTDALRDYVTEKAERLQKYYDRVQRVEVIFDEEAGSHVVEIIARADHHATFIAKHDDHDPYASVDQVIKELGRQLTRHKEKLRNRKHSGGRPDKHVPDETSSGE